MVNLGRLCLDVVMGYAEEGLWVMPGYGDRLRTDVVISEVLREFRNLKCTQATFQLVDRYISS